MLKIQKAISSILPTTVANTLFIRYFGFTKIPLLFFIKPTVIELTKECCVIKIPLNRRTKNHLGSMYFGVLAAGADLAAGLAAMYKIVETKHDIELSFKDFHADFIKRAEGNTLFTCKDVLKIENLVNQVSLDNQRREMKIEVTATCKVKLKDEVVGKFVLTLSLKNRTKM